MRKRALLVAADLRDIGYDGRVLDLRKAHILRHPDRTQPAVIPEQRIHGQADGPTDQASTVAKAPTLRKDTRARR